ncbi:hypothetical protein BS17DRAFT_769635 [Gyrodon lividus]|nr:hypothetical protein BS17DRAFT_769635 [Gyrodon lividus]
MSRKAHLMSIVQCLHSNGLLVAMFICEILQSNHLSHAVAQAVLTDNVTQICDEEFCREIAELTLEKHGLHFNATLATTEQLKESFINHLALQMQAIAPGMWNLYVEFCNAEEMDLGEFGGDEIGEGTDEASQEMAATCGRQKHCPIEY